MTSLDHQEVRGAQASDREPARLPQIQIQIDPDAVLIEFFIGDRTGYAWVITSSRITSVELPNAPEIRRNAQLTSSLIAEVRAPIGSNRRARLGNALRTLSSDLLLPIAPFLKAERLIIVPDNTLANVPWLPFLYQATLPSH